VGNYSFHYISNGQFVRTETKNLPDDLDALDVAEKLSAEDDIIVWSGNRFVARVKRNGAHPDLDEAAG
jgi:hypothetical protein